MEWPCRIEGQACWLGISRVEITARGCDIFFELFTLQIRDVLFEYSQEQLQLDQIVQKNHHLVYCLEVKHDVWEGIWFVQISKCSRNGIRP